MIAIIDLGEEENKELIETVNSITTDFIVTKKEIDICRSSKIILGGTCSISAAMRKLSLLNISNLLRIIKKPLLGIGSGMHLLCDKYGVENISCLGVIPLKVNEFKKGSLECTHTGFSKIGITKESKLYNGIAEGSKFYFEHSHYIEPNVFETSLCTFEIEFASSIEKDNIFGVQYYPEKSGEVGLCVLRNFIEL